MKATLTFELPEERYEHLASIQGVSLAAFLTDIRQEVRRYEKYDAPAEEVLSAIRELVSEALRWEES